MVNEPQPPSTNAELRTIVNRAMVSANLRCTIRLQTGCTCSTGTMHVCSDPQLAAGRALYRHKP